MVAALVLVLAGAGAFITWLSQKHRIDLAEQKQLLAEQRRDESERQQTQIKENLQRAEIAEKEVKTRYQDLYNGLRRRAKENPDSKPLNIALAHAAYSLGDWSGARQEIGPAEAYFREALEIWERLIQKEPGDQEVAVGLAGVQAQMGNLLQYQKNQRLEAIPWYDLAIARLQQVPQNGPHSAMAKKILCNASVGRGEALTKLESANEGHFTRALEDWNRAIDLERAPARRARWRQRRASTLRRLGRYQEAAGEIVSLLREPGCSAPVSYDGACVLSLCSAAARIDVRLSEAERNQLAKDYSGQAIDMLEKAYRDGYFQSPDAWLTLGNDPDLEPLRAEPSFQEFQKKVEQKSKAGG